MILNLYLNRSDNRKMNKSLVLLRGGISCDWKYPTNEDTPDIMLSSTYGDVTTQANYCMIQETGMYYAIESRTYDRGHIITLHCIADPLFTYRMYIGGIAALIERQEFEYNPYYVDPLVVLDKRVIFDTVNIGTIKENGNHVIINTTGGAPN